MTPENFDNTLAEFVKKHNLAVEELTERQLAEAIRQAIECGDFTRLVRVDNGGQQVVYIPFTREQELSIKYTSRIRL